MHAPLPCPPPAPWLPTVRREVCELHVVQAARRGQRRRMSQRERNGVMPAIDPAGTWLCSTGETRSGTGHWPGAAKVLAGSGCAVPSQFDICEIAGCLKDRESDDSTFKQTQGRKALLLRTASSAGRKDASVRPDARRHELPPCSCGARWTDVGSQPQFAFRASGSVTTHCDHDAAGVVLRRTSLILEGGPGATWRWARPNGHTSAGSRTVRPGRSDGSFSHYRPRMRTALPGQVPGAQAVIDSRRGSS